jgi:hypothetical protein
MTGASTAASRGRRGRRRGHRRACTRSGNGCYKREIDRKALTLIYDFERMVARAETVTVIQSRLRGIVLIRGVECTSRLAIDLNGIWTEVGTDRTKQCYGVTLHMGNFRCKIRNSRIQNTLRRKGVRTRLLSGLHWIEIQRGFVLHRT